MACIYSQWELEKGSCLREYVFVCVVCDDGENCLLEIYIQEKSKDV